MVVYWKAKIKTCQASPGSQYSVLKPDASYLAHLHHYYYPRSQPSLYNSKSKHVFLNLANTFISQGF